MLKNPEFFPQFTKEDKAAVQAVLDRGDLMSGREVAAFEEELAAYFDKRYAVCVSSGTTALECAFAATGEGALLHHENFIAAFSASDACSIATKQATDGVRADILGVYVAASGAVHDCAHRFDKHAAHAAVSCFSFNANKFIACCGGAVLLDNSHRAAFMQRYRNHGREHSAWVMPGRHFRMPEINAALGRSQLKRIGDIMADRFAVAIAYDKALGLAIADSRPSWFLYPVVCCHENHGFRSMADFRLFNTATEIDRRTALLPIYPHMTKADVDAVVACLRERKAI